MGQSSILGANTRVGKDELEICNVISIEEAGQNLVAVHTRVSYGPFTLRSIFGTARIKMVRVPNLSVLGLTILIQRPRTDKFSTPPINSRV